MPRIQSDFDRTAWRRLAALSARVLAVSVAGMWAAPTIAEVARRAAPAEGAMQPLNTGSLFQVAGAMLAIVVLIVAVAWFLRRFGGLQTTASGALKVLGGISMGTRERVVLMQVGDTQLLVGVTPGRVQTLHVLDKPVEVDSQSEVPKFADRLAEVMRRSAHKG